MPKHLYCPKCGGEKMKLDLGRLDNKAHAHGIGDLQLT